MSTVSTETYKVFDDPFKYFAAMLADIENACSFIYIETYRVGNDSIGQRFRDALVQKSREGVKIKILVDSWGTSLHDSFFQEILQNGGELRYFRKIKFSFDFFTKNHRRNHRKLLIIDNVISYIGSANYTAYSLNWREMMLRITGPLTPLLTKSFSDSYSIYNKYIFKKYSYRKILRYKEFEIISDLPSIYRQQIKNKFEQLINAARTKIVIETPYFLPGFKLRKEISDAAGRGVDVRIIIPQHSDVRLVDILRRKYLGLLHKNGVSILFYQPSNLHAKMLLIDDEVFSISSSNFDYRSFRYMYEIALIGRESEIVSQLEEHVNVTLRRCKKFDYAAWLRRPRIEKFFEWLLIPFRHLL